MATKMMKGKPTYLKWSFKKALMSIAEKNFSLSQGKVNGNLTI